MFPITFHSTTITKVRQLDSNTIEKRYLPKKPPTEFRQRYKNPDLFYHREVKILSQLKGVVGFPQLLSTTPRHRTFRMTNCGNPLSNLNAPLDWRDQILNITRELDKLDLHHNDMAIHNFVVQDGQITLIDFDKTTEGEEDFPFNNLGEEDLKREGTVEEVFQWKWDSVYPRRQEYEENYGSHQG